MASTVVSHDNQFKVFDGTLSQTIPLQKDNIINHHIVTSLGHNCNLKIIISWIHKIFKS